MDLIEIVITKEVLHFIDDGSSTVHRMSLRVDGSERRAWIIDPAPENFIQTLSKTGGVLTQELARALHDEEVGIDNKYGGGREYL